MPLEILPDLYDADTHKGLDKKVEKATEDLAGVSAPRSYFEYCGLLQSVIEGSNDMDRKYLNNQEAISLLKAEEELRTMLASAWQRKSYREIRNLAILRTPNSARVFRQDLRNNLSGSFEADYHGAAAEGFYEYLTHNEKLFKEPRNPRYYAKFCSIVQSSGTGKSRMLTELSKKDVIVIYMNLREKNDTLSFPARDSVPSQILTEFPTSEEAYRTVCYAFFIALFNVLEECLSRRFPECTAKDGIMDWARQMCDMSHPPRSTAREDFFRQISKKYTEVHTDLLQVLGKHLSKTAEVPSKPNVGEATNNATDTDVDGAADRIGELSLSEPKAHRIVPQDFTALLCAAYKKMAAHIKNFFPDPSNEPKLVIAIDEAHPLTPVRQAQEAYRPADVFCRVVNEYSRHENHAIWVVFASTTSKVADFSPPNQKYNSDRVAVLGEKIFPPYTQLGWDQSASALGEVEIEDISRLNHIAGYGRPLWVSLKTALTHAQRVLTTASSKLCGGSTFDPSKTSHVLAVLGQRFGLNVTFGHPDSIEHLEGGVASHLRICLATTLDRNWRFTSYPSEPLLACVAANDLHEGPEILELALGTLMKAVNSGMIDMGKRGELSSRLLWLLSKDLFIRTAAKNVVTAIPTEWNEHLVDCQMIPVVDWLEFVFGRRIWDKKDSQASLAREAFQDSYVNFSHWVCMEANITGSKQGDDMSLYEWTRRHWQRTSAVQCCHQQPLVDKVIPIYFKNRSKGTSPGSRMSHIFISDKARGPGSRPSKGELHSITRRDKSLSNATDLESLPYIAILADLGQPSSFSFTFPEREIDDRCLRIYAGGVDKTTYPFLSQYPALRNTLQDLVRIQQIPDTETPFIEYLDAQVKFGSTKTTHHMEWEHGRIVPDVQRVD